jgi:hypothetical protein
MFRWIIRRRKVKIAVNEGGHFAEDAVDGGVIFNGLS